MEIADIIPALATWITQPKDSKIAAVQCCGDTGFVKEAVKCADVEPVYVTMNGFEGLDLASAASSPIAVTFRKKVIVIFDFDAIAKNDPPMTSAIHAAMKINKVPFVLVGKAFRGKTDLPKNHAFFQVAGVPENVRKDKGIAGAEAALAGEIREYSGDGIAIGGVFDNYLDVTSFEDACRVAEAFSVADVIGEQLCRAGDFDDPYSFVPIMAASLSAGKSLRKTLKITTFGTVWSKTNAMYAKMNSVRVIQRGFDTSRSRLTWTPVTGLDLIRGMMTIDPLGIAKQLGIGPPGILAIMRLWNSKGKCKYTLATHAKVKKALIV